MRIRDWSSDVCSSALPKENKHLQLFGIKACDTMKKARTWLDEHAVSYDFHDYKTAGIDREHLTQWCDEHGWQVVLNRAGTTFRKQLGRASCRERVCQYV